MVSNCGEGRLAEAKHQTGPDELCRTMPTIASAQASTFLFSPLTPNRGVHLAASDGQSSHEHGACKKMPLSGTPWTLEGSLVRIT